MEHIWGGPRKSKRKKEVTTISIISATLEFKSHCTEPWGELADLETARGKVLLAGWRAGSKGRGRAQLTFKSFRFSSS